MTPYGPYQKRQRSLIPSDDRYFLHAHPSNLPEEERGREDTMNIREAALAYQSKTTLNICDLQEVSTTLEIRHKTGTKEDGETFEYKYIVVDEKEYRLPDQMLKSLQDVLTVRPECKRFRPVKTGEGLKTRYTAVPLD